MAYITAIIGRPNVGKSTLFNRITATNEAIVEDLPGVTRDRYYGIGEWCGHTFTLIDTGGYVLQTQNVLGEKMQEQIELAIEEADCIFFTVDCSVGITAEDAGLADTLRKSKKKVLVVANKADNAALAFNAHDFHTLGLGEVYAISASHGSGTGELLDALVAIMPTTSPIELPTNIPKLAFIGRPNVGKSTFVNALLGKERSIVDAKPNTTRTPVHSYYRLYHKELILIDTAGIAKKKQISAKSIELYSLIRSIRAIEQADVCVVLISADEGLTTQDKHILSLAHRKKKGIVLLVNKWDQVKSSQEYVVTYRKNLQNELGYMYYLPILFTSGLHKKQVYQTIEKALEVYANRNNRLSTTLLNKIIQKALTQHPPPNPEGKHVKINYAIQLPTSAPSFLLFCNNPNVPTNYKRYLEKQIRLFTNLEGVPITLFFRKK